MDRVAPGAAHLLREAPTHALMVAVMAAAIALHSPLVSIASAGLLVIASVVCARLSRGMPFLREHVIDLWAMALTFLVFLPHGSTLGHHALAVPAAGAFAIVVVAWGFARAWLTLGRPDAAWRVAMASGAFTGVGLAVMVLFCAFS
ncbi:MAG: hypothetical protein JWP19_237 [Rhodoglobus sp.]|nr:hypothetical protein [Rhodoglobus sp.]